MLPPRAILATALAVLAACPASASGDKLVFVAWNVRNYLTAPARGSDNRITTPAKAPASVAAVVATLGKIRPDIVGLCEMGSRRDLQDLQKRLAETGVRLPHATWVDGPDRERHLALLSRFPFVQDSHRTRASFVLGGQQCFVQRGFLDCTVSVEPGFELRILGAHLKSRRTAPGLDETEFRRNESLLLRRQVEGILGKDPQTPLLVFGDFNDTKNSPVVRGILGNPGHPESLTLLPLADRQGDQWTYRWEESDDYARVDFVMVSGALRRLVQRRDTRIHREPRWFEASDHRPLVITMRLPASSKP